jgi:cytochrome P450
VAPEKYRRDRAPGPTGSAAALAVARFARDPLDEYLRLQAGYGDAVRVPITPRQSLFILSRPEHAERVLAANQDNYVKAVTYRPLRALIGNGLLTSEGEDWRRHRRLVQPVFSRRDVQAFGPAMTEAAQRMLARWDALADGSVLNVAGQLSALALDIAGRALFGADLTSEAGQMSRVMDAGQRIAVLATFLPISWGQSSTRALKATIRRLGHSTEGVEGPVRRLIAARAAAGPRDGAAGRRRDLLDVLMGAGPDGGPALGSGEIADEVATFLLAGHETSANTLCWSLALLSAYPPARRRLEDEVDTVLAGRAPAAPDAELLTWTRAVVAEAMRLYPPAWTIERNALAGDDVAGVPVPAGSLVAIPPYLVHRHPEFWPDPAGFNPERFLPGRPTAPHRYAYIPFGGGRRACVGQSFAELETVLVLAAIAQRFRLELTLRGLPRPAANVTLRPGRALPMRLVRR